MIQGGFRITENGTGWYVDDMEGHGMIPNGANYSAYLAVIWHNKFLFSFSFPWPEMSSISSFFMISKDK